MYLLASGALAFTGRPWFDEAMHAGPALDLITRGVLGYPIGEPTNPSTRGIHDHMYQTMPLGHLGQAVWYKLVGFGVLRMRAYHILWGLAALASWGFIVWTLTGSPAPALLASFLMGTDRAFADAAASGRPDMMSAGLASLGIASYLALRTRSLSAAVLCSQVLFAASLFTHPVGALAIFALVILALHLDLRRLRRKHLFLAAVPYVVGFGLWGWYISRDPVSFRAQFAFNAAGRDKGITEPLRSIYREIKVRYVERMYLPPYATGIRHVTILIPILYAAAALGLLFGPKKTRLLGVFAVVYFLAFSLLEAKKYPFYLVHTTMLLASCLAVWAWQEWSQGRWRRMLAAASVAGLVTIHLGWIAYTCRQDAYHHSYLQAMSYLDRHAGPDSLIVGESELLFHYGFRGNIVDDAVLGYYSGKRADFIVASFNGYGETIKDVASKDPAVGRYVHQTLADDYRQVYSDRIYTVYQRR